MKPQVTLHLSHVERRDVVGKMIQRVNDVLRSIFVR